MNPNLAQAHNNLGIIFAQKRDLEQAIIQFQEGVKLSPFGAEVISPGVGAVPVGRLAEAVGNFEKALSLKPDYSKAGEMLAKAQAAMSQPAQGSGPPP